jgi:hypothetical protein
MQQDREENCSCHVGKRGAVQSTNSGQPVHRSGPGLNGPGTPNTSGRNPGACPQDFEGVGVGFDVGVGVGFDFGVDVDLGAYDSLQHKCGLGSGGGAPSGTSEASVELRSEATQRGPSLVLNQINRYTNAQHELQKRGRKRYCGSRTFRGLLDDGSEKAIRGDCKTWVCEYCGPRKAWRYKQAIRAIAERHSLTRFLTLTLDPSKIEGDPVRYLRRVFNKFRVSLLRKFGCSVTYIAILEFHKSGIPHLHVLINRFILQRWISESWSALGGGEIVDIRFVDVHRISHYLAKYLTKELLMSAPLRSRRVTTSRSIHLLEKKASETKWVMDRRSIFHLFAIFHEVARDLQVDCEGFLASFVIPVGIDTPPWRKRQLFLTLTLVRTGNGEFALLLMW